MDIDKMWVKFDELDVECWCNVGRKQCPDEKKPECKLYLVRFIEICDEEKYDKRVKAIKEATTKLEKRMIKEFVKETDKLKKEVDKSISKFKI